jgi:hypothetical protein
MIALFRPTRPMATQRTPPRPKPRSRRVHARRRSPRHPPRWQRLPWRQLLAPLATPQGIIAVAILVMAIKVVS